MPLKDTVKVADQNGMVLSTPDRSTLRIIQTPQTFKHDIICAAYDHLNHIIETKGIKAAGSITDDAMVVETFTNQKVYLSEGSYAAAFDMYASLCDRFITQARSGAPYDRDTLPREPLSGIWIAFSFSQEKSLS